MLKLSLFENAIRIITGQLYQFTPAEKYTINLIPLVNLVPMIYNYTSLNLSSYNVHDMIKMYIDGSINLKLDRTFISEDYENIRVSSSNVPDENLIMKIIKLKNWNWSSSYYDNVIYKKASKWSTYYDNDLVGLETILIKNNKCRRFSISHPNKLKEFYVATLVHMKFCFEKLGYYECYRIVKKTKNSNEIYENPYRQGKIKPVGIQYATEKEDLGDYLKIKYTPSSLYGLTIQDFKEAYGL